MMVCAAIRKKLNRLLLLGLCVSLATAGCADTASQQNMTAEQRQLREQKSRWNQTVATGAVAGAALGAGVGALAGGNNRGQGALIGALAGLVVGSIAGALIADRNLKFEDRELSAQERIAAAQQTTQNLESRAATSESIARNDRMRLDELDAQYRAKQITAAKYRADAELIRKDVDLMKDSAADAKKAREKIVVSGAQLPQLMTEEPKMGAAQRRLEQSADQIEEKLNRIPST